MALLDTLAKVLGLSRRAADIAKMLIVIDQAIDAALITWQCGCLHWGLGEGGGKYVNIFHISFLKKGQQLAFPLQEWRGLE